MARETNSNLRTVTVQFHRSLSCASCERTCQRGFIFIPFHSVYFPFILHKIWTSRKLAERSQRFALIETENFTDSIEFVWVHYALYDLIINSLYIIFIYHNCIIIQIRLSTYYYKLLHQITRNNDNQNKLHWH